MAPVVRELRQREALSKEAWRSHFCFSGQHAELALPFFEYFGVQPDSKLELLIPGQSLGKLTARACAQFDDFFSKHTQAAATLVQGDTTTAFTAGLIAFYHGVPVGHIEAGLRTAEIREPFPEELNRRLISKLARWHYAPTDKACQTLLAEGHAEESVFMTGNTGIDSLLWAMKRDQSPRNEILGKISRTSPDARLVLVTVHRRENIGAPLENIARALASLSRRFEGVHFVLPMHKNPLVVETLNRQLKGLENLHLTEPLEYGDLVWVMKRAELIMSDSGGIQEEAPALGKPLLVLRQETERPEAVDYGTSIIVGSDEEKILAIAHDFLSGRRKLHLKQGLANPYGDGQASSKIVSHLLAKLGL